jgi:hydrogenase maturation protease
MGLSTPVRVVGVGSPNGDDAVGWEVIRCLRLIRPRLPGVEFFEVGGGQCLLDLLDGQGTLILIDGLAGDGPPGTIRRFTWPDSCLDAMVPGSTHALGPAEALRLAAALGLLPPYVVIFCVEIAGFHPEVGVSAIVATAVPEMAQRIEKELACSSAKEQSLSPNITPGGFSILRL